MGTELHVLAMWPGESMDDTLLREFGHEYVCDGCENCHNNPEYVEEVNLATASPREAEPNAWHIEAVELLTALWDGWSIEVTEYGTEFLADDFEWGATVDNNAVSLRLVRLLPGFEASTSITLEDIFELFVDTGSLFNGGQGEGTMDLDDPMCFYDADDPGAFYDRVVAEHEKLNNPFSRNLVVRALFYKGLHCRSLGLLEDAALAFTFLIVRCGGVSNPNHRARVMLSFIHLAEMLEIRGESGRAAEYHSMLAEYRRPEDEPALRRLAVSASSDLAELLDI